MYKWIIYKTTCLKNNKIYVGQHKTKNINDGYMGSGKLIRRAFEKYGVDNFTREILCECDSREEACIREEYWIDILKSTDPEIGYNITKYAWGGQPHSEETLRKLSVARKGVPTPEHVKEKLRKPKSPEAIENMKIAAEEAKKKRIGKKWYHNPTTLESKQFSSTEEIPSEWIRGRGNTQKVGSDRKKKIYSDEGLRNIQQAAKNEDRNKKISDSLLGHEVSPETRNKISETLLTNNKK